MRYDLVEDLCYNLYNYQTLKMFFTAKNEDNVIAVVCRTLSLLRVKITSDSVILYLKSHPDYPSLKSVCDLLNEIRVENWPIRIDETELFKLETPFIAHLNEGQGKLILINKINNEFITYADSTLGLKRSNTDKFLKTWSRAVILLEPSEKSGEADYSEKKRDELVKNSIIPFAILLFSLICINGLLNGRIFTEHLPVLKFYILALTKSAGLFLSLLLFRDELNIRTKFTYKLCHLSTNTDCYAVTKSKASKIFGKISWADAGITYFTGGLVLLFLFPFTTVLSLFSVLSIAALPYPVFSILYQWLKIRKWCLLCISVQLVLICEFIILYNTISIYSLTIPMLISAFVVFNSFFLTVLLIKLFYIALKEKEYNQFRLMKLKRDPAIFHSQIRQGERINIPENNSSLIFGDKKSNVAITVFMSYYCSACAKKFKTIKKLIDDGIRAKVQLVFPASKDELSLKLIQLICATQKSGNTDEIPKLLDEWYNKDAKSKPELINEFNQLETSGYANAMMEFQSILFHSNKITKVPSVFVNGYPLPDTYELEDIKYFTDFLESMECEISKVEV